MSRIDIDKQYRRAIKELKALPNRDFKESLENLARAATANMERYYSDNSCTFGKKCKEEALKGFNYAMARYFAECVAATEIRGNTREARIYLTIAKKLNSL